MIFERAKIFGLLALVAGMTLAGCDVVDSKRPLYDGVPFRVTTKAVDKKVSRAVFATVVRDAGRSVTGARAAALHEGTRYCIDYYGSSDILWAQDMTDPEAPLPYDGSDAVFTGECIE